MEWIRSIEEVENRYDALSVRLADPALIADRRAYLRCAKQHSSIAEVVEKYRAWKSAETQIHETEELLEDPDPELAEMAQEEVTQLRTRQSALAEQIRVLLLPVDPADAKGAVLEIRAGTGGVEASLFALEVFRMYCKYAEGRTWKVETTVRNDSEAGGIKEVIALVTGKGVYSKLKYELRCYPKPTRSTSRLQTLTFGSTHTAPRDPVGSP